MKSKHYDIIFFVILPICIVGGFFFHRGYFEHVEAREHAERQACPQSIMTIERDAK